ncbi:hypothetical protein [Flavivirga spongiicola]|uniref:Response regulatory domain-containing protein n=1 Tax=Flavivirga spongiicola TaxID=421621 RepID=A0ABU7XZN3_9FLAO|nr:hypothetical protein [Flavivirga sp. MEBiC05379]MDO5980910.1 hypothetical protein [Flavivirga sp. MEBiC05379]
MIYYIDYNINTDSLDDRITGISPADFMELDDVKIDDNLVVLCELDISSSKETVSRKDFYGVSFVQELRRKNYMNKVLFVSFLHEDYYKTRVLNSKIMFFPGHGFIQLPTSSTEWIDEFECFEALSDLSLYDVKNHCCGIEQVIEERFHSLTPKFNVTKKLTPSLISEGNELVKLIYDSLNKPLPKLDSVLNIDVSGIEALRSLRRLCEIVLPESTTEESKKLLPKWKHWKVLWLDDEENEESPLFKELVSRLGSEEKVILCKTFRDAVYEWEADKAFREIALVICDYRLKKEDGTPAKKQGYDFMKYLSETERNVGKIAYSGLKRKFLIESFKYYGIQINIYSKIDFNQYEKYDLAFLTDEIVRLGDDHWIEINNGPQATEWANLASTYHKLKNGFSFYTYQNHVSRLVKQNLDTFINNFNSQNNKQGIWSLKFTDTFKVRTSCFPERDDKKTVAIKEILITRRFAIGLYAFLRSDRNKQTFLLDPENYLDYIKVVLYNSASNGKGYVVNDLSKSDTYSKIKKHSTLKLIPKFCALIFDSTWPIGLLPEEIVWLEFDSGLGLRTMAENQNYWLKIESIRNVFKEYFASSKYFQSLLNVGSLNVDRKVIYFKDDFEPIICSVNDIKDILLELHRSVSPSSKNFKTQITTFVGLLEKLLETIDNKSDTPKNIKTLISFINKLPAKTKGKYKKLKRDESIIEECLRLFAPWKFLLPKIYFNEDIDDYRRRVEQRIDNYKLACKDFELVKSKWKIYSFINNAYKEFIGKGLRNEEAINKAIYFGIHSWKDIRNSIIQKEKESSLLQKIGLNSIRNAESIVNFDFKSIDHFEFTDSTIEYSIKQKFIKRMKSFDLIPSEPVSVVIKEVSDIPDNAKSIIDVDAIVGGASFLAYMSISLSDYHDNTIKKINDENLSRVSGYVVVPF